MTSALEQTVPVLWREYSLGEILTLINGRAYRKHEERDSGAPVLRIQNLNGGQKWFYSDLDLPDDKYCEKGDLLFAWSATFGPYIWWGEKVIYHYHIWKIECGPKLDKKFAYYLLQSITDQVKAAGKGISMVHMTKAGMESWKVRIPKIEEQKRIAAILDRASELSQSCHDGVSRLRELAQSIFHEMFGDPVHNERKWTVEKLGDLTTKISSGSTPKGGSKNYVDDGITFLRSQNVWRNRLELDDVVCIDEATHQRMKKSSLKHGDILITKTGRINTENSSLGRAAMFLGEDDSANVNGHVYLVRPKPDVLKEFVLYIMTTPEYREYIRSVCVGGIDKRQINKEHLEEFPIIYPPIEKQKEFLKKLKAIEEQKARFNEQLKLAETLFLSLQQRAFRGEL